PLSLHDALPISPRRQRGDRYPLGGQPRPHLGPPGLRRRLRGRLPRPGQGQPRDEGLGRRAVTEPGSAAPGTDRPLHIRWLGSVPYREALALQQALFAHGPDSHLLLLEHPHVYTLGVRGDLGNLIRDPAEVGAELVHTDRGGDVTYHGPGQLVGYPILSLPGRRGGGLAETRAYVAAVEQLVIDVLGDLGLEGASRLDGYPGVWVDADGPDPRKICAIGVRLSRGRTMHGFALNVDPDLTMFGHIVPCGIADKGVTSLAAEGIEVTMRDVVDAVARRAAERWGT